MIPKTLKIELNNINRIKIGAIYLIIKINSFSRLNSDELLISSIILSSFRIYPANKHVHSATIGINILFDRKSKNSKNNIFSGFIFDKIPNPRVDGNATIILKTTTMRIDLKRVVLNRSDKIDTIVSIIEIDDVIAANKTNTKKRVPIKFPIGICENRYGIVSNIKPGPALIPWAFPLIAYIVGITIIPAKKAMPVSKNSI